MNESNDSEGGRRASQDRRWWQSPRAAFTEWKGRQDEAIEIRNRKADEQWRLYGRVWIRLAVVAGFVVALSPVAFSSVREYLQMEKVWEGVPLATLIVGSFVTLMAAWRGRQFQSGLAFAYSQGNETRFMKYLEMATNDSERVARVGFTLLRRMLPTLNEEQRRAVYQAIISAMSLRKHTHEALTKEFERNLEEGSLRDAVKVLEGHLAEEASLPFRQFVLSFWQDYTRFVSKHSSNASKALKHFASQYVDGKERAEKDGLLLVEDPLPTDLNFSYLDMGGAWFISTSSDPSFYGDPFARGDPSQVICFRKSVFFRAKLGSRLGVHESLAFYKSILVEAEILSESLEERCSLSFYASLLCRANISVAQAVVYNMMSSNLTGAHFTILGGVQRKPLKVTVITSRPHARNEGEPSYWVRAPRGAEKSEREDRAPKFTNEYDNTPYQTYWTRILMRASKDPSARDTQSAEDAEEGEEGSKVD